MSQSVLLQDRITRAAEPAGVARPVRISGEVIDRFAAVEGSTPARGICVAAFAGMLCWIGLAVVIF
jgi:hypothetical protein